MLDFSQKVTPSDAVVSTPELVRQEEARLIKSGAVTEAELIERASEKIVEIILSAFDGVKSVAIVVGGGNNGSDGLSSAIRLISKGIKCTVYQLSAPKNSENKRLYDKLLSLGVDVLPASSIKGSFDLALDCMFGIGLNKRLDGENALAVKAFNALDCVKIAVDIPSGLSALTGFTEGDCVVADYTIALCSLKIGHLLNLGLNYCGKIVVADIGVKPQPVARLIDGESVKIARRLPASHKGDYGKISVIGGSECMPGAPLMTYESAVACSRCGAGLVRLCIADSEKQAYQQRVKEQTLFLLPSKQGYVSFCKSSLDRIILWSDVIVIGMGMGENADLPQILQYLAANFTKTLIIDADGLNALAKDKSTIKNAKCNIILTPHVGEFARLCPGVQPSDMEGVKQFAGTYGVTLALKSATTVITDGDKAYLNVTGSPAMAKGGSGDVLAGMIAAFAANLQPIDAATTACYYFGKCGENAEKRLNSQVSVLASDIIISQKELFL